MSWMEELYKTYDNCIGVDDLLIPTYHMVNNTQIEIIIDGNGNFLDATREELKNTIIPCTEKSEATRTNNPPPHPLCDKIQFVAKDYNGSKKSYYNKYIELLGSWARSPFSHSFVNAVYKYINKGHVIEDLRNTGKQIILENEDPADLFIRWSVEIPGIEETKCWKNNELYECWKNFCSSTVKIENICFVTGEKKPIAVNHPKRIRNSGDSGKLISSNDKTDYTFRGRFLTDEIKLDGKKEVIAIQPASVSIDVSQKAHRALSWLINRQGFKNGDQVIVSWAVSGKQTPYPFADTLSIFDESYEERIKEITSIPYSDAGQFFARKLNARIAGYKADLGSTEKIVVMGLDSAIPGRIAITYYRELTGSEFLERIEAWHQQTAWHFQIFLDHPEKKGKKITGHTVFAPTPNTIAEACYGTKRDEDFKRFKKTVVERLLPCIIDGAEIPVDLVNTVIHKVSNPMAFPKEKHWQWEQALSVACALFRCYTFRYSNLKIKYDMALEHNRDDRDYLYGRLLAVAERIEEIALNVAKEQRETNSARLMQRFADHPYSTWRNIESSLRPYVSRLRVNRPPFLYNMQKLLDEVHAKFKPGDYENDTRLSGAYLLGYHCQRLELRNHKEFSEEKI